MKKAAALLGIIVLGCACILSIGCSGGSGSAGDTQWGTPNTGALNSAKEITNFEIVSPASTGTVDQPTKTISVIVPNGTAKTSLVARFITTGAKTTVGTVEQKSETTANNFSGCVTYTVTAKDKSTADYKVYVYTASENAKEITGFSIPGQSSSSIIGTNITVIPPYGSSKTSLTPAVIHTGSSVSPASGASQNFTNPVTYTVTAANGMTKDYTVTVEIAKNSAKDITDFKILGVSGVFSGASLTDITVTVPYGQDLSSLTPLVTHTGAGVSPASGVSRNFTGAQTYTVTADDGSVKVYTVTVVNALNSAKNITACTINGVAGTIGANTVSVVMPYGTDRSSLTPVITISGDSISPASGTPRDFTSAKAYIVTAADGSTKTYTVTVTNALNSAKNITAFSFGSAIGTIGTNTISVVTPYGTDRSSLTPAITITGDSISPAVGTAQNFTSPVAYTVTAADGSTKTYTVTVTNALNPAKDITSCTVNGVAGTISGTNITVILPTGTSVTSLAPLITITGASVSPASGVSQNFTNPVTYTVTAADGGVKVYTVKVSTIPPKIHLTSISSTPTSITCTWTNPTASTFDHIVATAVGAFNAVCVVSGGTNTPTSVNVSKGLQSYTWTGLSANTRYIFEIAWSDGSANYGANSFTFATTSSGTATCQTISTAAELASINTSSSTRAGSYLVTADIDLSSYSSWTPIGTSFSSYFSGNFNGNNYTMSNLAINSAVTSWGLFGAVMYGSINNICLEQVNIDLRNSLVDPEGGGGMVGWLCNSIIINCSSTGSLSGGDGAIGGLVGSFSHSVALNCFSTNSVTAKSHCGGFVGLINQGTISNCYATGLVSVTSDSAGGFAGYARSVIMSNCYATGSASGTDRVGGFIGVYDTDGTCSWSKTVSNCYATGSVFGTNRVGGLVGYNYETIKQCFATGLVTGSTNVGGLVGYNERGIITSSYSTGLVSGTGNLGGLVGGNQSGTITSSYYDADTSGYAAGVAAGKTWSVYGTPLSTSLMKTQSSYTGWDFSSVWNISSSLNSGYPYLRAVAP